MSDIFSYASTDLSQENIIKAYKKVFSHILDFPIKSGDIICRNNNLDAFTRLRTSISVWAVEPSSNSGFVALDCLQEHIESVLDLDRPPSNWSSHITSIVRVEDPTFYVEYSGHLPENPEYKILILRKDNDYYLDFITPGLDDQWNVIVKNSEVVFDLFF